MSNEHFKTRLTHYDWDNLGELLNMLNAHEIVGARKAIELSVTIQSPIGVHLRRSFMDWDEDTFMKALMAASDRFELLELNYEGKTYGGKRRGSI